VSFELPPPDPTNPDLLIGIFQYLKGAKLVREPSDETYQDELPPMWIEPRLGCPAPGNVEGLGEAEISPNPPYGPGVVASIEKITGIPSLPYEGFLRTDHVQFIVRSYTAAPAFEYESKVRALINDKRGWLMYNVPVNESLLFRDLQLISKDNIAFTYAFEYSFSLWGPFTPVGP
jgi:hypothetical protein